MFFESEFNWWKQNHTWKSPWDKEEVLKVYERLREIGLSEDEVQHMFDTLEQSLMEEVKNHDAL